MPGLSNLHGLSDLRVIDLSTGIAGPYCTKMFADAGADVVKVEPPEGDPLRSWSATGNVPPGHDGALFRFLNTSKRSVVAEADEVEALVADADLVVESLAEGPKTGLDSAFGADLLERLPGLVRLTISPFGRNGPYAERPWTEFTLQAESGSLGRRGLPSQPPVQAGGRITDWVGGTFAAVAALAAVQQARREGQGEDIDFSLHECLTIAGNTYADLMQRLSGQPLQVPHRTVEIPSIEPTADGWVGFNTNSRAQYQAFLTLIERPDLLEDAELAAVASRKARMGEWNELVRSWTRRHPTAEIVSRASRLRIPVAPVCDGASVVEQEHFRARGVFVTNPDGTFIQPRPPYLINGSSPAIRSRAPSLGEHSGRIEPHPIRRPVPPAGGAKLPLEGIRVLDCTAWWAGPTATQMLGVLGADVIHVESIQRIDGMRMIALIFGPRERWWEQSTVYLSANTNKRNLTLDLSRPEGLQLGKGIIASCDVVVENFSPRVFEKFGLGWDAVHDLNPRTILVRMPAFGLDGPWRDNVGFAQTMEQISGMAWITGHVDDQPRIPQGPCDPLAGMNAAFATLVALAERDVTGEGSLVEGPMVEGALNAGAEQIVEYSAYGRRMQRDGNRSPWAAPQGVYPCRGTEQWLAVSVATDKQWQALVEVLGTAWALDPALASFDGRKAASDRLDAELAGWAGQHDLDEAVARLIAAGVPAARVVDSRLTSRHPQLLARKFYEMVDHPVVGTHPLSTVPFRFASRDRSGQAWLRRRAPLLGEHNAEILQEILGLTDDKLAALEADGVIGTRPAE